jgi:hypothetical protein
MFLTKGVIYLVSVGVAGVITIVLFSFAAVKEKSKRILSRKLAFVLALLFLAITIYGSYEITRKAFTKIRTTVTTLKNFPQTVESSQYRDTTDYVRILKSYEPLKYKGKVPDDYYTFYGFRDWWRFPVVYPYSVNCIDVLDKGGLVNDSGKTNFENGGSVTVISPYFNSFMFDKNYFIGQKITEAGKDESAGDYFVLFFQSGKIENVRNKVELYKKLDVLGFQGSREFISTRTYSERF